MTGDTHEIISMKTRPFFSQIRQGKLEFKMLQQGTKTIMPPCITTRDKLFCNIYLINNILRRLKEFKKPGTRRTLIFQAPLLF
jgi:hypothetical protein